MFFSCYPFLLQESAHWAPNGLISLRYNQKQNNNPSIKKLQNTKKQRQRDEIVQSDSVSRLTVVSLVYVSQQSLYASEERLQACG